MKILAIDTSGQQATAAIINDQITIGETFLNAKTGEKSWTHSEILMPAISNMLKLTGVEINEIDYIAYTKGPGSFTGLRIGVSTALGLAHGINKPTIPVPTLDALAYNVVNGGIIIPMMDARRGQVYFAIFEGRRRISDYLAMPIEEALKGYSEAVFLGDGADAYKDEICKYVKHPHFAGVNLNRTRASSVGAWALDNLDKAVTNPTDEAEILYIRQPQALRK